MRMEKIRLEGDNLLCVSHRFPTKISHHLWWSKLRNNIMVIQKKKGGRKSIEN
jgi:hypothetical protein